ncbi:MAG: hypothetical protein HQL05_06575 [Nitrospirae bacterium]|uniref:hypothetical protein n=1 Tax=Candidatus Magnetobacterium casense TaxID=1455061 RepID=UPI00058FBD3C|nr:hypothetical protein [Candidatus Magnetobacterium casensis]MBF0337482.1 hypothetical protein [Nitrospirota bacterium]
MNMGKIAQRRNLGVFTLFATIAGILFIFGLTEPYHYDTAEYMQAVQIFKETSEIRCFPVARCFNSYSLLPLSLLTGYMTLPVTVFLSALLTLIMYFFWIRALTDHTTAAVSTTLLFIVPASIMTITHMKEDFLVLMYMLAAMLLVSGKRPGYVRYAGGVLYALAILSKEMPIMFLPLFVTSMYVYSLRDDAQWGDFISRDSLLRGGREIAVFLLVTVATVSVFDIHHFQALWTSAASPYVGQFKGLFSSLFPVGISSWRYGVGTFLFVAQFIGLASIVFETDRVKKTIHAAFILEFVLLFFFLCNLSVRVYRHFLWPSLVSLPLMVVVFRNALSLIGIRQTVRDAITWGTCILIAMFLFYSVYPVLSFHRKVNTIAEFYKNIPGERHNTLVMGMDNCIFVRYFSHLRCISHPVDATEAQARDFANSITAEMQNGTTVLVLPDFLSYDAHKNITNVFTSSFPIEKVYSNWFQDYHFMDYGYTVDEYRDILLFKTKRSGKDVSNCNVVCHKSTRGTIALKTAAALDIEYHACNMYCEGGSYREDNIVMMHNRLFPDLKVASVVRLHK